jgi:hypothetical protein
MQRAKRGDAISCTGLDRKGKPRFVREGTNQCVKVPLPSTLDYVSPCEGDPDESQTYFAIRHPQSGKLYYFIWNGKEAENGFAEVSGREEYVVRQVPPRPRNS